MNGVDVYRAKLKVFLFVPTFSTFDFKFGHFMSPHAEPLFLLIIPFVFWRFRSCRHRPNQGAYDDDDADGYDDATK